MRPVRVATDGAPFRVAVQVGAHRLPGDAPKESGGGDTGPDPHEWLMGALGACTSITVKMYADRKGWPLTAVDVQLGWTQDGDTFVLSRRVHFEGALSDEQRARLLDIANKCPIHKVLTHPIRVETSVA